MSTSSRVKIYSLESSTGAWKTLGVGFSSVVATESGGVALRVEFDDNSPLPFELVVDKNDLWKHESEAIIQVERSCANDIAFSFQSASGAEPCWQAVSRELERTSVVVSTPPAAVAESGGAPAALSEAADVGAGGVPDMLAAVEGGEGDGVAASINILHSVSSSLLVEQAPSGRQLIMLPAPTIDNLAAIIEVIRPMQLRQADRSLLSQSVLHSNFLRDLYATVFVEADSRRDMVALSHLNELTWTFLLTYETLLLNELISDAIFLHVLGTLEYDHTMFHFGRLDKNARFRRFRFRRFVRRHVRFRQVVPISDAVFVGTIHQLWRLNFLRDIIRNMTADENVVMFLDQTAMYAETDVVDRVASDKHFLVDIFRIILAPRPEPPAEATAAAAAAAARTASALSAQGPYFSEAEASSDEDKDTAVDESVARNLRQDALGLLSEFVSWTKNLALQSRMNMYASLQLGAGEARPSIFLVIEAVLDDAFASYEELSFALDIIYNLVSFDPSPLRDFCCLKRTQPPLPVVRKADVLGGDRTELWTSAMQNFVQGANSTAPAASASGGLRPTERGLRADGVVSPREHGSFVVPLLPGEASFAHRLVRRIVDDPDVRIQGVAIDILRALLDLGITPPIDIPVFLDFSFSRFLPWLFSPFILAAPSPDPPRPVEAMKNLDSLLNGQPGLSSDAAVVTSAELLMLQTHLRRNAHSVRTQVVARLLPPPRISPDGTDEFSLETDASKASKQVIAELLLDLYGRFPLRARLLITKFDLFSSMISLCRYKEKHLVMLGVKLIRVFVASKDSNIYLCVRDPS